jgi:hypothetical protein
MKVPKRTLLTVMLVTIFSLALQACATSIMMTVPKVAATPPDYAIVTFIRAGSFGGSIDFGLWDGESLVGVITPNAYIQYKATPGKHLFLGRAENWTICEADLAPGQNYYIMTNTFVGFWKARVAFDPVRKGDTNVTDDQIKNWMSTYNPTGVDPAKKDAYVSSHLNDVKGIIVQHNAGKTKFETMSAEDWR